MLRMGSGYSMYGRLKINDKYEHIDTDFLRTRPTMNNSGWVPLSSLLSYASEAHNLPFIGGRDVPASEMSVFKYEVFTYALERKHCRMKSLYLYNGNTRVAKAICPVLCPYMEITFNTLEDARKWDDALEILNGDIPWTYRMFYKKYRQIHTDKLKMRVYQRN